MRPIIEGKRTISSLVAFKNYGYFCLSKMAIVRPKPNQ